VANVRGSLLPVVDLKQFLEGERTLVHEGQRVLVVRQTGGNVAVIIDELYGQRTFNDTHRAEMDGEADGRYAQLVNQVYRLNDVSWGVFSMQTLTRTPEFRQATL
jgi:twitching motility protein PilI